MARNVIQGSKKRTAEEVRWFNPETELESVYELAPLTKDVKETVMTLREDGKKIIDANLEREGVPIQELNLTLDEDEALTRNSCEQINALTKPSDDSQLPLGDVILDQWERNLVVDSDITLLCNRLWVAAGKPSAS